MKAFYAGKLCDHIYFLERALWQPQCEGWIGEGQDWGMGNEGEEGVKNDAKVLSLATPSGIVILLRLEIHE